jgi:hypothetical protein
MNNHLKDSLFYQPPVKTKFGRQHKEPTKKVDIKPLDQLYHEKYKNDPNKAWYDAVRKVIPNVRFR